MRRDAAGLGWGGREAGLGVQRRAVSSRSFLEKKLCEALEEMPKSPPSTWQAGRQAAGERDPGVADDPAMGSGSGSWTWNLMRSLYVGREGGKAWERRNR